MGNFRRAFIIVIVRYILILKGVILKDVSLCIVMIPSSIKLAEHADYNAWAYDDHTF